MSFDGYVLDRVAGTLRINVTLTPQLWTDNNTGQSYSDTLAQATWSGKPYNGFYFSDYIDTSYKLSTVFEITGNGSFYHSLSLVSQYGSTQEKSSHGFHFYYNSNKSVIIDAGDAIDIAFSSRYADKIYLYSGADLAYGGDGNDAIDGGAGNDRLYGESGDDTLIGGQGADRLYGGIGSDTVSYFGALSRVVVNFSKISLNTGDAKGDAYSSIENLIGSSNDDILTGNNISNIIKGGYGFGNDTIYGGGGNDRLYGESGSDRLYGGDGDDRLYGGEYDDLLVGGAGKDLLDGGLGGADVFDFNSVSDSGTTYATRDEIINFSQAYGDIVDLRGIDARASMAGNNMFKFIGEKQFSGKEGELRSFISGGKTYIAADIDGDRSNDFTIQLNSAIKLVATDFIL